MIAFDTLSELESYAGAFPAIGVITGVMDRSLPYDQGAGRYDTPEKSDVSYIIDEFLTSQRGFPAETHDGNLVMEIVLDTRFPSILARSPLNLSHISSQLMTPSFSKGIS